MSQTEMTDAVPTETQADSTWNVHNVYGLAVFYHGSVLYHCTKRIAITCDSSMQSEAIPTKKGTEIAIYASEVMRAFGAPVCGPVTVATDSQANMLVARNMASASRAKHFVRMYASISEAIADKKVKVVKVSDAQNPTDFLTKWLGKQKYEASVRYMTNSDASLGAAQR